MSMDQLIGAARRPARPMAPATLIKDSDTKSFVADVIEASQTVPVIVDFWATWCGPCKTLGPALEKAVIEAKGAVRLVKIDVDKNQPLAQQMRIQSIPAVYAFFQGRPVDGFVGALPDSQIKSFVAKLAELGGGRSSAPRRSRRRSSRPRRRWKRATMARRAPSSTRCWPMSRPMSPALAGLTQALTAAGELKRAREVLARVPAPKLPETSVTPAVAKATAALELAEQSAGARRPAGRAPGQGRGRCQGLAVALRSGAGPLCLGRAGEGAGRAAGDRRAQPALERGGRAQAAGQVLRGAGPRPSADALGPPAAFLPAVPMSRAELSKTPKPEAPPGRGRRSGGPSPFDPGFADLPTTLPIFPLPGVLLLPGGRLPLNVFEPRYLAMTRAALAGAAAHRHGPAARSRGAGGMQPEVQKVGCAGRIVSFAETDDGRYLITLAGLCRFAIMGELPLEEGFRKVVPDWTPYAADLEPMAMSVDRIRLIGALRAFFADQPVRIDWKAIEETADDRLIVSLAMLCPFEAAEKQILLEAPSPSERARVMIALLESAALAKGDGDAPQVRH